jgi:hypothetical protein
MTDMIYNLDGGEVACEPKATLSRVWGLQITSKMIMFRVMAVVLNGPYIRSPRID